MDSHRKTTLAMDVMLAHHMFSGSARVLCRIIRLPIVVMLLLTEPIVNVACGALVGGSVLTAVVFAVSAVSARFPFLLALALCASAAVFLLVYHSLLALLVRD